MNIRDPRNRKVIYIEEEILDDPAVASITGHFKDPLVVPVKSHMDIVNRHGQNTALQHSSGALILARQKGTLIYPGAPVCQSFGNENFYYTSSIMNCPYNCEYCYLKGMMSCGYTVIYVNISDTFAETDRLMAEGPAYICVSYDTDILALEGLTGFTAQWAEYTASHPGLRIEVRTKSASLPVLRHLAEVMDHAFGDNPRGRSSVILAWSLNPQEIVRQYEKDTPDLNSRLSAVCEAVQLGFTVRLVFDPMIYVKDWRQIYHEFAGTVFSKVDPGSILDASIGSFRISKEYLKNMRQNCPDSAVIQFPYSLVSGYYQYPESLRRDMEGFMAGELKKYIPEDKIYGWK